MSTVKKLLGVRVRPGPDPERSPQVLK